MVTKFEVFNEFSCATQMMMIVVTSDALTTYWKLQLEAIIKKFTENDLEHEQDFELCHHATFSHYEGVQWQDKGKEKVNTLSLMYYNGRI